MAQAERTDVTQPPDGRDRVGRIIQMADLLTPWAVRAASTLGLPDAVAAGASSVTEIAVAASVNARAAGKLLRFLARRGVFTETAPDRFALGPLGQVMAADLRFPLRMILDTAGMQSRFGQASAGLADAVRSGRAAYPVVFGRSLWADLAADPVLGQAFDELMTMSASRWVPKLMAALDWGSVTHVADIGGGTGELLIELLRAWPRTRGTLVELPDVAERAVARLTAAGFSERAVVTPGSFFQPLPQGADLYVLAQILHDWPDPEAELILRRCREAAGPAGRVLLVERMVDNDQPEDTHMDMDLLMLVLFGATERSRSDLARLAGAVGLRLGTITPLGLGMFAVECEPAGLPSDAGQARPASSEPRTGPGAQKAPAASAQQRVPSAVQAGLLAAAPTRPGRAATSRRLSEPPACPPGWRCGPPDFVGVGASSAGTAWWARLIAEHPGVASGCPELRFFQGSWDRELTDDAVEAYYRWFPRPAGAIAGEWTPRYMHDAWVLPRLHRAAPQARVLVLLRDPMDRFRVAIAASLASRGGTEPRVVTQGVERGRYAALLAGLCTYYDRKQILVLQTERCALDPVGQFARTCQFLDLAPSAGSAGAPPDPEPVPDQERMPLPRDLLDHLTRVYRDDARRLAAEWPDIDLSLWPGVR